MNLFCWIRTIHTAPPDIPGLLKLKRTNSSAHPTIYVTHLPPSIYIYILTLIKSHHYQFFQKIKSLKVENLFFRLSIFLRTYVRCIFTFSFLTAIFFVNVVHTRTILTFHFHHPSQKKSSSHQATNSWKAEIFIPNKY